MAAEFKVAEAYADFTVKVDAGLDAAIARIKERGQDLYASATVKVDADTALANAKLKELGDKSETVKLKVEADQASIAKADAEVKAGIDKATKDASSSGGPGALAFAGLFAGLPVAAAAAVAATGVALSAVPVLFAGLGVSAVASSNEVQVAWAQLSTNIGQSTEQMGQSFKAPVLGAVSDISAAFGRLSPQISQGMQLATGSVKPLVGSVTDLAENAMPGLVTAVANSVSPLNGLRLLSGQVGSGLSDMFTNMASQSVAAGQGLSTLGGILQDALGFVGQFFANVSAGSAGPLSSLQAILREVEGTLSNLTSTGSGALGFFQGFTNAGTGALAMVNALAIGLSALPPQVSQFAGSATAAGLIMSKFGVDLSKPFEGLGTKISAAQGPLKTFSTTVSGLASAALSPAILATAGLSIGLELLGAHQQQAAADAQAQTARVQTLTQALRESNGVIDANVKASAAQTLTNFQTSDGYRNLISDGNALGISTANITNGYLGNVTAQKSVVDSLQKTIDAHKQEAGALGLVEAPFNDHIRVLNGVAMSYDDTGFAAQQLLDNIQKAGGTFANSTQAAVDYNVAATGMTSANTGAADSTSILGSAMLTLKDASADTATQVSALQTALDLLSGRSPTYEAAVKSSNDAIRSMSDSLKDGAKKADGMGSALLNMDGTINTVTKNGSSLQGLATGLQTSFANTAEGIKSLTDVGVPYAQATKQVNDTLETQRNSFIKIATQMGLSGKAASDLADKYGLIPKDITTFATADVKQAQAAVDALPAYMAGVHGAVVTSANIDPATGNIDSVVTYADGSKGTITIDGNYDLATGKTNVAVNYADGSTGVITVDAANAMAKAGTLQAVKYADGQTGYIVIGANTAPASSSMNSWLSDYIHSYTIPIKASTPPGGILPLGSNAKGGLAGDSIQRHATGGSTTSPINGLGGGLYTGPGTKTSDSMLSWVSDQEFITNAADTANNLNILKAINAGQRNFSKYPDTGMPGGTGQSMIVSAPSSSPTVNNITINPPAGIDVYALAAMVSREIELSSKVGV